jgi:hypothetical protein
LNEADPSSSCGVGDHGHHEATRRALADLMAGCFFFENRGK